MRLGVWIPAVVLLTLFIGVLNLCLGYALAVHLGYGPAGLLGALEALSGWPAAAPGQMPDRERAEAPPEDAASGPHADVPDEQLTDSKDDDDDDAERRERSQTDEMGSLPSPDTPETWNMNERYVETSILKLNVAMISSGFRATEIDTRLRACRGRSDLDTLRKCLADLKEDGKTYLFDLMEAADEFRRRMGEMGGLGETREEIEAANLEQAGRVKTMLSNLDQLDIESDLEEANRRMLAEIARLRVPRHRLRDHYQTAFLAIARCENRLDRIEPRLHNDSLTRLPNRIGLEGTLWQWWQEDRHKSRQINAALFDLDGFDQLNEEHGSLTGDRILYHIAGLIQRDAGKEDVVGRFAGQRFLVVMPDIGPRTAVKNAELMRQKIEKLTFLRDDREIRLTIAAGVTEVSPDDTHQSLLERLEETLNHAKQAGPNRSFFHDGSELEPIESPNLGAKETEILLGERSTDLDAEIRQLLGA